MIALLQRVTRAEVRIEDQSVAAIGLGLLVFVAVRPADVAGVEIKLLNRILKYRVFGDELGKMNLNLGQIGGDLLLVPQFTLAADTRHGLRPGFSTAATPEHGRRLFEALVLAGRAQHPRVESGVFGAHMQISLVNNGPVTFWLET